MAEEEKRQGLETELAAVKVELQFECSDHDSLRTALGVVCNDLGMTQAEGVSSVMVQSLRIMERARELTQTMLHFGVHQAFVTARSHYSRINMEVLSEGYAPRCKEEDLDKIETEVAPLVEKL